ncbi:hypothetical protein FPV67DRAFT_1664695 [Lyophyllum atratum]|nr:hypothetical protein FPV67DRAFT_1664695 [Lyophyllum atratum]
MRSSPRKTTATPKKAASDNLKGALASPRKVPSAKRTATSPKKPVLSKEPKKPRGSLRCKRCKGSPLLKECEHSAKHKKELARALLADDLARSIPATPTISQLDDQDASTVHASTISDNIIYTTPPIPQSDGPASVAVHPSPKADTSVIDPQLLGLITPRPVQPIHPITRPSGISQLRLFPQSSPAKSAPHGSDTSEVDMTSPPSSPMASLFALPSTPSLSQPRTRANMNNQIYGLVDGAMRGNQPFGIHRLFVHYYLAYQSILDIPRKRPLRIPMTAVAKASDRFREQMMDIITRVERLALETNSWLFVAGQHPHAASSNSFLHYESPNLLSDALMETNTLVNGFGNVVEALVLLNKKKVIELNNRYAQADKERTEAQEEARQARVALAEKDDQNILLTSIIQRIQSGTLQPHQIPEVLK